MILTNKIYYQLKPLMPRSLQIALRRMVIQRKRKLYGDIWPIDEKAGRPPDGWRGWPDEKKFALVLMHDVDTEKGHEKCLDLAQIDERMGFRSSFNFVPERYLVSSEVRRILVEKGFEVGVHGLKHDGKLFSSRKTFLEQAVCINQYLKDWRSVGFVSPSMHRNLDWVHDLNVEYDASTFDTDPFEPQPEGVSTIFPFWESGDHGQKGYVELPYTLSQDHTLFVVMGEKSIDIWKQKLDWIVKNGGMALLITHPDYMSFNGKKPASDEYPAEYYKKFLEYIKTTYKDQYWNALPKDVARFWTQKFLGDRKETLPKHKKISLNQHPKGKMIWIDLDNSPHVPFFLPIIKELNRRGFQTILTARDCSQTCGIADLFCLDYRRVGKHYGKNKILKVAGTLLRGLQLSNVIRGEEPILAISHGSRAQMFSAFLLRIPSVAIMDYEHTRGFIRPDWVMMPELISVESVKFEPSHIFKYPGIKEDVYVPNFMPDMSIKTYLKLNEKEIIVTVRPPATEAHYHNPQSEGLFMATVNYLGRQDNVRMVILPRYDVQRQWIKDQWPEWCGNGKIVIPEHVVDGLNLIWFSDLVISGGGTMNREAAALSVPVYSIFRGKLGAVDRYLSEQGRLILLEDSTDIPEKIKLVKRQRELQVNNNNRTLDCIIDHIVKLIETRAGA